MMFISEKRLKRFISNYLYEEDYKSRIAELEREQKNLEDVTYHPKITIYSQNALKHTTMFHVPLNQFLNLLLDHLGLDYEAPKESKGRLFKKPTKAKK